MFRALLTYASAWIPAEKRWRMIRALECCPPLFIVVMRIRHLEWQIVDRAADLVIEGYQSSGNTFARKAMEAANPGARLASHIHSWAHVCHARMLRKPVVVLLRAPEDAIASHMVRMGLDDPRRELTRYATFYRGVERIRARCVIAPFPEVTTRYGDVIRRVNDTFGTSFVPFDHDDPALTEAIFAEMDREMESIDSIWKVARPREERAAATAAVRARLQAPELSAALARCQGLYQRLLRSAEGR